jgi:hypothetical protein
MVLPDAIVAARLLQEKRPSTKTYNDSQQRLTFLKRVMSEVRATQQYRQELKTTLNESIELCRFYPSLDYFVKDCSAKFLFINFATKSKKARIEDSDTKTIPARLFSLELARLQRGFIRYNTFQTLIDNPGPLCYGNEVSAK